MSGTPPVTVDITGSTLVITLNRPERRNAVNLSMATLVAEAVDRLDSADDLRVGVITGAGGTFSAGMDLREFAQGVRPSIPGHGFCGITERPPAKPLIAAVEGYAYAGGCEIALACDLIVAAHDAHFGLPEVKHGLVAAAGALLRLPHRVPIQIAAELAMTGEPISAYRAHHFGLVNRLVPPGEAMRAALDLAAEIARHRPAAIRATKRILTEARDWNRAEEFARQREISEPVFQSEDAREGARAFSEKRVAQWQQNAAAP
jgi:enoyl-CoA hydratase